MIKRDNAQFTPIKCFRLDRILRISGRTCYLARQRRKYLTDFRFNDGSRLNEKGSCFYATAPCGCFCDYDYQSLSAYFSSFPYVVFSHRVNMTDRKCLCFSSSGLFAER